ncbi:MAG: hypothetical protein PHU14_04000 [Methylovulum sp.]|nr:hypothetical protein [Methylovulum sp.]
MSDMKKHRRQVAWVCFGPYLSEGQLIAAINILEEGFQNDSVSGLITYITRVCSEFNIDTATRKNLYGQFHELMGQPSTLAIDPLDIVKEREAAAIAAPPPMPEPVADVAGQVPQPPALPTATSLGSLPDDAPPHAWLFSHFVGQLLLSLPDTADFIDALTELSRNKKYSNPDIEKQVDGWLNDIGNFLWTTRLSEQNLEALMPLIYTAICEALGPIVADDYFNNALAVCEQTPQASQFAPRRFLATSLLPPAP